MSFTRNRSIKEILNNALLEVKEKRRRIDLYQLQLDKEKKVVEYTIQGIEKILSNCEALANASEPRKLIKLEIAKTDEPEVREPAPPTRLKVGSQRPSIQPNGKYEPGYMIIAVIWEVRHASEHLTREQIAELVGVNGRGLSICLAKAVKSHQIEVDDNGFYYTTSEVTS